ncbi:AAA family ATPase [Halovenus carboxidivorans]|uniref:AAA family ATPase n=1 Tax=Halovenus carboxidivorans TaxID=2692199 RepID=UPI0019169E2F
MSGPLLIVYCGLPGVGKSTVSAYTADQLSAVRLRSDEVRYDLFDEPEYTAEEMRRTYDELLDRARQRLAAGEDVVVDGTFKEADKREQAAAIAAETDATVYFVRVTCPPDTVRERLEARTDDASDADLSVYQKHREQFEAIDREHVVIDNGGSLPTTRSRVDRKLLGTIRE